ncbi:FtsQ-type POTRA domain-containing protein [Blastococcus sp. BMG 814]|uniref:Cell division protein FtsQ n=1 Tax=Blastococcus carthaginiensis TaxID=3050034 RepID=A0ABT9IF94_9ACTN|nr:FtsQ-type POTRA domain-containing protein [Blastococcus carthaginiensis]MDP5184250.1 FtsQ-type POTRA domain-containing protein [Blastococcus carthaginiensis]
MNRTGSTTRDRSRRGRGPADRRSADRRGTRVTPLPDRRPARKRTRHRRSLQVAAALTVVAAIGWLLWLGPWLAVRAVQVDGTATLTADRVREVAQVPEGVPLLRVDLDAVEDRVARLPQVRGVEAARGWPDRIVITVAERVPVAVVGSPGRRSLVDAEGVLIDSVTGDAPRGVVPLTVDDPAPADPATMAGIAAIRALPEQLRADVVEVAAPDAQSITLTLADGTVVVWGGAEESATKGQVLVALLDRIADGELEPADLVDVSAPDAVVLR